MSEMKISKIIKKKGKHLIYIDGEYEFSLSDEGLYRSKLSVGKDFEPNEHINEIIAQDQVLQCKNRAMVILSSTPKSIKIIKKRLSEEGYSLEAISETIDFLTEYNFVDDSELAKSIVRSGVRKNNSKRQIYQKLYQKGIDKEDGSNALEAIELDEEENALQVAIKKYRSVRNLSRDEIIKKIRYALSYRGFSYGASNYAIQEIKKMIEEECEES